MLLRILAGLTLALVLGPPAFTRPPANGPETTATIAVHDPVWPPFSFGTTDPRQGFAREVLERCLPATGHAHHFVTYPVARMFLHLSRGDLDVNVISHRRDRETIVAYGQEALFQSSYRPIVRRDRGIEITRLSDMDDLRLGAILGVRYVDWFADYLEQRDAEDRVEWAPTNVGVLKMLLADRIDVYVSTVATARFLAAELEALDRIEVLPYDLRTSPYFVVVSKASRRIPDPAGFLAKIDACVRDLKAMPAYRRLLERYHVQPAEP